MNPMPFYSLLLLILCTTSFGIQVDDTTRKQSLQISPSSSSSSSKILQTNQTNLLEIQVHNPLEFLYKLKNAGIIDVMLFDFQDWVKQLAPLTSNDDCLQFIADGKHLNGLLYLWLFHGQKNNFDLAWTGFKVEDFFDLMRTEIDLTLYLFEKVCAYGKFSSALDFSENDLLNELFFEIVDKPVKLDITFTGKLPDETTQFFAEMLKSGNLGKKKYFEIQFHDYRLGMILKTVTETQKTKDGAKNGYYFFDPYSGVLQSENLDTFVEALRSYLKSLTIFWKLDVEDLTIVVIPLKSINPSKLLAQISETRNCKIEKFSQGKYIDDIMNTEFIVQSQYQGGICWGMAVQWLERANNKGKIDEINQLFISNKEQKMIMKFQKSCYYYSQQDQSLQENLPKKKNFATREDFLKKLGFDLKTPEFNLYYPTAFTPDQQKFMDFKWFGSNKKINEFYELKISEEHCKHSMAIAFVEGNYAFFDSNAGVLFTDDKNKFILAVSDFFSIMKGYHRSSFFDTKKQQQIGVKITVIQYSAPKKKWFG